MKNAKSKKYILGMFPYPSGEGLHVGHVRIYTACDVMARYYKMKGHEVLSPMGWDAFGLPAENAAIKNKMNPQDIVPKNYNNFRAQMKNMNFDFDWDRELATTDPTYYGLTQWIFLKLYSKGLVYREQVPINWCPKCKTGIANEEVLSDGTHERCGTVTGKKMLPQWVMRITSYAEELLKDLGEKGSAEELNWPNGILEMQRNWIGKKEGARIKFQVRQVSGPSSWSNLQEIEVFTTRVDTIDGVTFVVVAPERVKEWMDNGYTASRDVGDYVQQAINKTEQMRLEGEKEKTGVATDLLAINPLTGEQVPIYVADYVLSEYGTGCVMGVPQYDERDLAFAKKYNIAVRELPLLDYEKTLQELCNRGLAKKEITYHLRDWVFSRQRYWGEPIPLVYCDKCGDQNGVVPLTEGDLPLELPYLESYEPTDTGESPLTRVTDWVRTKCPRCGGAARRETDTMPNWAGSCWYFLAYPFWNDGVKAKLDDYKNKSETPFADFWKEIATPEIAKWLPVDWYLGGAEHAVLHLLYARFWVKVLYDLELLSFPEPFLRLRSVGMVLATDGRKMSKSWGNVINPDSVVKEFGSDAVRLYEMFMGPWDQAIAWDTRALIGQQRFVDKLRQIFSDTGMFAEESSREIAMPMNKVWRRVDEGILNQQFNTAIASMMEFVNVFKSKHVKISRVDAGIFVRFLRPFAPGIAQEIWELPHMYGKSNGELFDEWSKYEVKHGDDVLVTIAVQVNGKMRGTVEVSSSSMNDQAQVVAVAREQGGIAKYVTTEPKKIIYVPGRVLSLIV